MKQNRIHALDITRGIAVFGMIFMNFKIALNLNVSGTLEYSFLSSQEGRFGALFIFLAGMGISLMNRNTVHYKKLIKRALFLFVLGMVFSLYWQADIFHFYAFYILISLPLIKLKEKTLWKIAFIPALTFVILNIFLSWESGWNWELVTYEGFYHPIGFIRNLFFNGFHPVFPWISFLIMGMAVGKSNLYLRRKQWKTVIMTLSVFITTEMLSFLLVGKFSGSEMALLFSTEAMPPFPLFVISAGAQNILLLNIVLLCISYFRNENYLSLGLRETGKMVMTHYILHLVAGLLPLYALSLHVMPDTIDIFIYSLAYFGFSIAFTILWKKKFSFGPFESLMRIISKN